MVIKGKNRDTAWYAMTDEDWPDVKRAFQAWLDPSNFDADGQPAPPPELCADCLNGLSGVDLLAQTNPAFFDFSATATPRFTVPSFVPFATRDYAARAPPRT